MRRRGHPVAAVALAALVVGAAALRSHSTTTPAGPPPPMTDTQYVSRRCVTRLWTAADGALTAQTTGGLLHRDASGVWHEIGDASAAIALATIWSGKDVTPQVPGLLIGGRSVGFPAGSPGTHVAAVCLEPDGKALLCAVWGDDALYRCDPTAPESSRWKREPTGLPASVGAQITAVVETPGLLCVGTRREGIWERTIPNGDWQPVALTQSGPYNDDAEAICAYRGALYISTLEDGLDILDADGWRRVTAPTISSEVPRQMVVFRGVLYVRNGNGRVDRFDGTDWSRNVCAGQLPRNQVSAFATDGATIYVAQWGGWSAWDGANWKHHLDIADLKGTSITALLPDPDGKTLWVGTQGKGLAEVDIATGAVRRWHGVRGGLPDDWITCLARGGDTLYAGTFVGGLAVRPAGATTWTVAPGSAGENITDLAATPHGVIAATRHGVLTLDAGLALPESVTRNSVEAQALCVDGKGLWVGTRTGIQFVHGVIPGKARR